MINHTDTWSAPPVPDYVTGAEKRLWPLSGDCGSERKWRHDILPRIPDRFAGQLADLYEENWPKPNGRFRANTRLRKAAHELCPPGGVLSEDADDLRRLAKLKAGNARWISARHDTVEARYRSLCDYAEESGIVPAKPSVKSGLDGANRRMCDDRWWRRRLKRAETRAIESAAIEIGLVHKKREIYVSTENLLRRRERQRRNRNLMETLQVVNELGEAFNLQEVIDGSLANPVLRRNELMVRIAGSELHAKQNGYEALFLTLTCPSRFHARYGKSGDPNLQYDGNRPSDGLAYLNRVWSRARAAMARQGVDMFGIRIAEPHHDGTPHWHILVFVRPDQAKALISTLQHYALQDSPDEPGAQQRRFKVEKIDPAKGTAIGYVAKYISKNVDGYGIEADELGLEAPKAAERVKAWSTAWGIRQFQFFGGPPVSVWRELWLLRDEVAYPEIEAARQAADQGEWAAFIEVMGGMNCSREDRPITLAKGWSDRPNCYEEPIGEVVFGVQVGEVVIQTRVHVWIVESVGSDSSCGSNFENQVDQVGNHLEFCQ
ncbi:MAG: replication endonuclease [Candidatus Thiodiazotropha endolucinida]|uniref:Replication endonuclease n=1 Tax=Candidatus Thiodiazotropha taylori TaxID=2792791 RepID=A0A9E4NHP0_9GAMM|nr:replication endonuclease [Candidatus Thiodiazotropha taylori]MCW4235372.1 replication endonuclease [Candidatus Thiodiazotropha endolucinida]